MRIGEAMGMPIRIGGIDARTLHLEQRNAEGGVDVTRAASVDRRIAVQRQQLVEPMVVTESNADDDGGSLKPREVRRSRHQGASPMPCWR